MDLCNINDIKALLARHGFHFSKAKGQNFLTQSWVPREIVEASGIDERCGVLEVGPGIGPLTNELCRAAKGVHSTTVRSLSGKNGSGIIAPERNSAAETATTCTPRGFRV